MQKGVYLQIHKTAETPIPLASHSKSNSLCNSVEH